METMGCDKANYTTELTARNQTRDLPNAGFCFEPGKTFKLHPTILKKKTNEEKLNFKQQLFIARYQDQTFFTRTNLTLTDDYLVF